MMMLCQTWTLADSKIALDTVHDDNCHQIPSRRTYIPPKSSGQRPGGESVYVNLSKTFGRK